MNYDSPIKWIGDKSTIIDELTPIFPKLSSFNEVAEPFGGGSLSVVFALARNTSTYYFNDNNSDLINFWIQLRDNGEQLAELCSNQPYSRDIFEDARAKLRKHEGTPLELAMYFWLTNQSSLMCVPEKGWASHKGQARVMFDSVKLFSSIKQLFRDSSVQIHNEDCFHFLNRHKGSPNVFIFCDPPYLDEDGEAMGYYKRRKSSQKIAWEQKPFDRSQHKKLSETLQQCKGKVMLTTYGKWMPDIYGWMNLVKEIERKYLFSPIYKTDKAMKKELVFTNYEVSKQLEMEMM